MESKIVKRIEAESRMVVVSSLREGKIGRCWSKSTKFQLCKMTKFWESTVKQCEYNQEYCIVQLKFAKKIDLKHSHYKKMVTINI